MFARQVYHAPSENLISLRKHMCDKLKEFITIFGGHESYNFSTFPNFTKWLHRPVDASALAIFRMLYGLIMLIDLAEERGGGQMDIRFGEPLKCHFPLFKGLKQFSFPTMGCIYMIMWFGALGIALGYRFRLSCLAYIAPYWYIFLLDKPSWNNHSYLFGLVGAILLFTQANHYWALDKYLNPNLPSTIPYWNYFLIKFQFFILYMYAGTKKFSPEWLAGYAMSSLSHHWVLTPFCWFLSYEMVDLLIVHWFTAAFDFSIAFFMTSELTRIWATPFMVLFHLMNSRLFVIGMFPWVCLAQVPMFYSCDWPRKVTLLNCKNVWYKMLKKEAEGKSRKAKYEKDSTIPSTNAKASSDLCLKLVKYQIENINLIQKCRTLLVLFYCCLQLFLPYSHFITQGYNNWTNGLYGYSWDMMVHSYETLEVQIKIVDNLNQQEHYMDPYAFTEYDRWTKYADMAKQYAQCIRNNLQLLHFEKSNAISITSLNISIYIDVWCSMNGRLMQRVFDPRVDLLTADWFPFKRTAWSLPLLDEFKYIRPKLLTISNEVYNWNNATDVLFIADFPGLTLKNMLPPDIINTTLTILEGNVRYDEVELNESYFLTAGKSLTISGGVAYHVTTVGLSPAIYMLTYTNKTILEETITLEDKSNSPKKPWLPLLQEFKARLENYKRFLQHMGNCVLYLLYGVPIPLQLREKHINLT
uniref:HTTM-like domain-containing protein n=1 Tax=Glossina brevipalpis TaxID=37001 RepID=A0A1A9W7G3_9MUSC